MRESCHSVLGGQAVHLRKILGRLSACLCERSVMPTCPQPAAPLAPRSAGRPPAAGAGVDHQRAAPRMPGAFVGAGGDDGAGRGRQRQAALVDHSRTPASRCSPASASVPPTTMIAGFRTLTTSAATSPSTRPASRTRPIAPAGCARPAPSRHARPAPRTPGPQVAGDRPAGRIAPRRSRACRSGTAAPRRAQLDVADVARRATGAAMHLALGDDAAADAGAGLDEHAAGRRPARTADARSGCAAVDVVVGQDRRRRNRTRTSRGCRNRPSGHHRGADDPPGGMVDRRRQAQADAQHLRGRSGRLGQQSAELLRAIQVRIGSGPMADIDARRAARRAHPARDRSPRPGCGSRRYRPPAPRRSPR